MSVPKGFKTKNTYPSEHFMKVMQNDPDMLEEYNFSQGTAETYFSLVLSFQRKKEKRKWCSSDHLYDPETQHEPNFKAGNQIQMEKIEKAFKRT